MFCEGFGLKTFAKRLIKIFVHTKSDASLFVCIKFLKLSKRLNFCKIFKQNNSQNQGKALVLMFIFAWKFCKSLKFWMILKVLKIWKRVKIRWKRSWKIFLYNYETNISLKKVFFSLFQFISGVFQFILAGFGWFSWVLVLETPNKTGVQHLFYKCF